MPDPHPSAAGPRRQLTLFDAVSIIIGIVIGAGIYMTSPLIAASVPGPGWLVGVWIAGGVVALIGALCYAELTTSYPQEGGDYVYLTRAFGRRMGFVFSWASLWIVRPGSIGFVAYVFADYARQLYPFGGGPLASVGYACAAIAVLSLVNFLGVREGKWMQNALTLLKVVGLLGIAAVGLLAPQAATAPAVATGGEANLALALILVLYTYGGWNDMSYVAAEVRDPDKNLLRALLLGTLAIVVIYVLLNLAFLRVLGFAGVQNATALAADVVSAWLGPVGGRAISVLICLSCLGAINGMIFTGARVYYAVGQQHRLFAPFAHWNRRCDAPLRALVLQAAITLLVVGGFGLYENGFERMVNFTTPVFWFFFFLVGLALIVLRRKEPHRRRPYRVPGYPLTPLVFCLCCLLVLYSSLRYAYSQASIEALWAVGLLLLGVALSLVEPLVGESSDVLATPDEPGEAR